MNGIISNTLFHQNLRRCFQDKVPDRIMLALSGGVDSMCLAYLLAQYKAHVQPRMLVSAITIDHGFRKESATEAQKVGEIVRSWGLSHSVEKLQYSQDVHSISNFEEMARVLRYKVFREKCLDQGINALLVAHNRDDQLETFLQRLHMNSTMFGLLGLREKAPLPLMDSSADVEDKIHVYRPLLQFEKSSIRSTCEAHAVPWFEDVSNQDISLTKRNLLRYIINEYVPQSMASRPELACISRKSLFETTSEVEKLLNVYDTQKEILDQKIKSQGFFFDAMQAHMEFTIPLSDFDVLKQPVLARWLYEMIYPISSAKHFHWSYAKLERQAMPRLWAWLDAPDAILAMTYLNVSFRVQIEDTNVKFHISRQVPQRQVARHYIVDVSAGDTSWHLFDRIWWLKVESLREVHIRYFNTSMREKLHEAFGEHEELSYDSLLFLPIVLDATSGEIVAVPTLNLTRGGISVKCKLKKGP